MKTNKILIAVLAIFVMVACRTNPFSGKKDLALVSDSELFPMAFEQYDNFLDENQVITGTSEAKMVKTVGQKITQAAKRYLHSKGYSEYLKDYKWEYHLVKSDEINAWCMPGGKIVVYTGILPITKDEAGLAVVLGHEVSHAPLNHSQRKMSQEMVRQGLGQLGSQALGSTKYQNIFNQTYGIGSQVAVSLPYSRKFESQADKLGLTLMAMAGYDPDVAVQLWQRMSQNGGKQPPEWLSTHPSNQTRISNIQKWASDAKATARKFGVTSFKK